MKTMEEKVEALPKWVREYIGNIKRERKVAIKKLNDVLAVQEKTPFYVDDFISTGEDGPGPTNKRVYFNAKHRMIVVHAGIELDISLQGDTIDLRYNHPGRLTGNVAMFPRAHQQVILQRLED